MNNSTVCRVLADRLERDPDSSFFHCGAVSDPWLSLSELDGRSGGLAGGLTALGIQRGDRVALLAPNRIEVMELVLALVKMGAIQVPLNYWIRGEFLRYQLNDCGAKVLVTDREGYETARPLLADTEIEYVVLFDEPGDGVAPHVVSYAQLCTAAPIAAADVRPSELVSIVYTSGTTAKPKGCMLSNGYYVELARAYGRDGWVLPDDRACTPFPLFHSAGQVISFMSTLLYGASLIVTPEFHASTFMSHAAELDATILIGIGAFAHAILERPPRPDDGAHPFRLAIWTPLPVERQQEFERRFRTPVISEGYGQTESLLITRSPFEGGIRNRETSGKASPLYDVQVVDEDDNLLPPGQPGQIVVRPHAAHTIYSGYWNKPQETVKAWSNLWHHTGDLGRIDADGYLTFIDRMSDRLRRRGENVSSLYLEATIRAIPGVADVAVSAVPGRLGDDDIKACIVETEPGTLTPAAVFEFLRERVAYFAIPRFVHLHESLPTNALQRVMKQQLRDERVPESCWDLEELGFVVGKDGRRGAGAAAAT